VIDLSDSVLAATPDLPSGIVRRRRMAQEALERALKSVDPEHLVRKVVSSRPDLEGAVVFAFGKAARPMAQGFCGVRTPREGVVVAPQRDLLQTQALDLPHLEILAGQHPLPALDAPEVGRKVLELAQRLTDEEVAVCLVSGGGSALLELPREGVSIADIRAKTEELLASSTAISELNRQRESWSQLKGGKLAQAMNPARVINLILSDVPGNPPRCVASGPTVGPGTEDVVLADNATAQRATGFVRVRPSGAPGSGFLDGEASAAGARFYQGVVKLAATGELKSPGYVCGGETTVEVGGDGLGGRNQEFLLGALLSGYRGGLLLAFGTDGLDGNSGAAGAFFDEAVVARARELSLDPKRALQGNDSARFWEACGGRIRTGSTSTNVADLVLYIP
jgi:glycerate 2-kinase